MVSPNQTWAHHPYAHQKMHTPIPESQTTPHLPEELLENIILFIPQDALLPLRLSCRILYRMINPYIHNCIFLSSHKSDLDIFLLLTKNPSIIPMIKELVWDDCTYSAEYKGWKGFQGRPIPENWRKLGKYVEFEGKEEPTEGAWKR